VPHDLIIKGGSVVDGTGSPARTADVAIDDGLVTEIGKLSARGRRELNADGLLVTPGFVDIHTHYDAQIGWDPLATSSSYHGVTSIVMGNCGMTFAPCREGDREFLARAMESVEDIPAQAIISGLPWDWESYGEYLDSLQRMATALNVGGMVGHGALRWWAMGDRSLDPDITPTAAELTEMTQLLTDGMVAGALGFSTSRTLRHKVPDGRYVPGTFATTDELAAFADVLGTVGRGVIECAPRFDGDGPSEPRARSELAWMRELSIRSGRPITFNLTHTYENPDHHRLAVELAREANANGATIRPQTTTRGIGVLFSLATATPFNRHPSWAALGDLSPSERLARLRDGTVRATLIAEAATSPAPAELARFYVTDGVGGCRFDCAVSLPDAAAAAGVSMAEWYIDFLVRTDGAGIVYWPILNQSLDAVSEMLAEDVVVLGLADGGAHVGQILDASQPTWFLTYWVGERQAMSVERAVQRLSADGAELYGLAGRGTLQPGSYADVNLIEWDRLALPLPTYEHDFPHGAGRFVQKASGYHAMVVNGEAVMEEGIHTGALPGHVLRGVS
jgi:N-acyl-D-aspartate/D-glutamate deacylase